MGGGGPYQGGGGVATRDTGAYINIYICTCVYLLCSAFLRILENELSVPLDRTTST